MAAIITQKIAGAFGGKKKNEAKSHKESSEYIIANQPNTILSEQFKLVEYKPYEQANYYSATITN